MGENCIARATPNGPSSAEPIRRALQRATQRTNVNLRGSSSWRRASAPQGLARSCIARASAAANWPLSVSFSPFNVNPELGILRDHYCRSSVLAAIRQMTALSRLRLCTSHDFDKTEMSLSPSRGL
jgi:hypothetical protein